MADFNLARSHLKLLRTMTVNPAATHATVVDVQNFTRDLWYLLCPIPGVWISVETFLERWLNRFSAPFPPVFWGFSTPSEFLEHARQTGCVEVNYLTGQQHQMRVSQPFSRAAAAYLRELELVISLQPDLPASALLS